MDRSIYKSRRYCVETIAGSVGLVITRSDAEECRAHSLAQRQQIDAALKGIKHKAMKDRYLDLWML